MTDTTTQAVERCAECTCKDGGIFCNWIAHGDPQVRQLVKDHAALLAERDALAAQLAAAEASARESALDALAAYGQAAEAHEAQLAAEARVAERDALRRRRSDLHPTGAAMTQTPEELAAPLQKYIHASTGMWPVVSAYQGGWVKADEAAAEITALQARIAELEARAEATEAALPRAWEMGRDAAGKTAGTYCHLRTVQGGRLKSPAVFTTHTWQEIQECIRALTPPADLADRVKGGGE